MKTIAIELDEQTWERARRVAEARQCSLDKLLQEMLERIQEPQLSEETLVGMFAHEAELMDEVVESAMRAREARPLRRNGE